MAATAITPVGGSQPHTNMQPYLCINFIISLFGIFPRSHLRTVRMADPFVAEIRIFPFNFAPKGWAWCDGQLLPISQNTALFSLLGTTYGGDGKSTFALPDLAGPRADASRPGPRAEPARPRRDGGRETVTLLQSEMPAHTHTLRGNSERRGQPLARRQRGARPASTQVYQSTTNANLVAMAPEALLPAGGDQPHNNLQPYLTFYFNIALQGVFPPRT